MLLVILGDPGAVNRVDNMIVVTVNFHHEHFIDPINYPRVSEDGYWSEKKKRGSLCKAANAMKRIESFASPPYFITLLNFKCECILHRSTVEPRYNEPLHNEVLRVTNDFL